MPGLYINDGGGLSSALGNAVAGFAANSDPKTIAEAALLREQTLKAYTDSAQAADLLKTGRTAEQGIPGLTTQLGMNIPAPGGGVAGTTASLAVPPDGSAAPASTPAPYDWHNPVDESSFTPWQTYLANEMRNGRLGAETLKNAAVPLGQTAIGGPGSDSNTQTDIAKANQMPYDLTAGTVRHFRGPGSNLPETTSSGPDINAQAVDLEQRKNDVTDANKRATDAQTADQQINENNRLLEIYNRLVNTPGTDDTASIVGDQIFKNLAAIPAIGDVTKLSSRLGAIDAIRARLANSIGSQLKTAQGPNDAPIRGLLSAISPPDPGNLDPESFRLAMEQYNRVLQYQKDEGPIAETYRNSDYGKGAGDAYRAALKAHSDAASKAATEERGKPPPKPSFQPVPDLAAGEKLGPGTYFILPDGSRHKN